MRILRWPLICVALVALIPSTASADTIVLKNGRLLSGKVLRENTESITIEVADGQGRMTIHKATVARVCRGDEPAPAFQQGIFPGNGPIAAKTAATTAADDAKANPLAKAATTDLEARLRALGPTRDDLLAQLRPTPDEAADLARLERGLASGDAKDVAALAGKGRLALMVAARALSSPDRKERSGGARVIARLARDERTLPFILALGIPEKLIDVAADEKETASPLARSLARKALEAVAKTDPTDDAPAETVALTDSEKAELAQWRTWWAKEKSDLASWESKKDEERVRIRAELARRGLKQYKDGKGRIEVRLASAERPSLPEPRLVLPRLVMAPPSDLAIEGDGEKRLLRFATVIENHGDGALEVRRSGVGEKDVRAVQRVFARYPGDERIVVEHETTVGEFVFHEGHHHFHLVPFASYELLDETFEPALGAKPAEKVSFCLRDSRPTSGGEAKGHYAECGRELQGISPGFADVYKADLPDQDLAIGEVPDGVYYVVNVLTAGFELASSPEDRVAATKVRIAGTNVQVLARLDGRALEAARAQRRDALGAK